MAFDQDDLYAGSQSSVRPPPRDRLAVVNIDGAPLETTPVFDAYWYFAFERQNMFHRRLEGLSAPQASEDPILAAHRFTNAYRASDRVSQYLIRQVIWTDGERWSHEDLFFRILIFKLFNRIDTWEALTDALGPIRVADYDFNDFEHVLGDRQRRGVRNYSAAYIMPSAGRVFGHVPKHANHLRLLEWMLENDYPGKLRRAESMCQAFELLASAPSIGPFLAYQFVTDLNYSELTDFSEMEFVVAGPGALDGISKCFSDTKGLPPERIIQHMAEMQTDYLSQYCFTFRDLWGRPLQLIDCQNLFCEISKYSRAAFPNIPGKSGRTRIKQKYKPAGDVPRPWYPPNWGLNEKIAIEFGAHAA